MVKETKGTGPPVEEEEQELQARPEQSAQSSGTSSEDSSRTTSPNPPPGMEDEGCDKEDVEFKRGFNPEYFLGKKFVVFD